jgi:hypothetical protein
MEQNKNTASVQSLIDTEFKRAIYKLDNGDVAGAENIFENLAFTYNVPMAWIAIGNIKLNQLETGKTSVQQALKCFVKASDLLSGEKPYYQSLYCESSLRQIEKLLNYYSDIRQKAKKAKSSKKWNLLGMALSIGLGNQNSNSGNNAFRGTAGVAGAAYSLNQLKNNSMQAKEAEKLLSILDATIKQVIDGVKYFCSDNQNVYQEFLKQIERIGSANKLLKEISGNI